MQAAGWNAAEPEPVMRPSRVLLVMEIVVNCKSSTTQSKEILYGDNRVVLSAKLHGTNYW